MFIPHAWATTHMVCLCSLWQPFPEDITHSLMSWEIYLSPWYIPFILEKCQHISFVVLLVPYMCETLLFEAWGNWLKICRHFPMYFLKDMFYIRIQISSKWVPSILIENSYHWLTQQPGVKQVPRNYLNQWCPNSPRHICITRPQYVEECLYNQWLGGIIALAWEHKFFYSLKIHLGLMKNTKLINLGLIVLIKRLLPISHYAII